MLKIQCRLGDHDYVREGAEYRGLAYGVMNRYTCRTCGFSTWSSLPMDPRYVSYTEALLRDNQKFAKIKT